MEIKMVKGIMAELGIRLRMEIRAGMRILIKMGLRME